MDTEEFGSELEAQFAPQPSDFDPEMEKLLLEAEAKQTAEVDASDAAFHGLLREYRKRYDLNEALSKAKTDNQAVLDHVRETIVGIFAARGLKSVRVEGVGLVNTAADNKPRVVDEPKLFDWMWSIGHEGSIKQSVNWMTLRALLNDRIAKNQSIPPPTVVEITPGTTLRLTRSKT